MREKKIGKDFALSIVNRLDFFKRFTPQERISLVQFHQHYTIYSAGEILIEEGTHDDCFFIVLSGGATVTTKNSSKSIAMIEPGEIVGEISFLTKSPRSATITAETEFIVIKVDETMLEQLKPRTREKFKDMFIEKLIERLNHMNHMIESPEASKV
ncbi:MAG: hypothetical protein COB51_11055 [Moraxellaceae bacterium]|nr:MAG: hypothetical protein COB51_11055 [Moraxellaceae bacterium]